MWCEDPLLTCLKAFGYSVVRFPGPALAPLQLLARFGRDLETIGPIDAVLVPGRDAPLPPMSMNRPCPRISGQSTSKLDASLGLSLLGSVVSSMGGSPRVVKVLADRAREVTFEFSQVSEDCVQVAELDRYLAGAHVSPLARHVRSLLESDDLYVTTSIVKSPVFSVEATDEHGIGIELDLPSLQALAGAEIKVSSAGASTSRITFEGGVPLAFGFRGLRLFYDHGRYTAFKPLPPGDLALARHAAIPEWYRSDAPLVRLAASRRATRRPSNLD